VKDGQSNYIQEAKKSALEDLVSSIKVNVSATSVLNQLGQRERVSGEIPADDPNHGYRYDLKNLKKWVWQDDRNYWFISAFQSNDIKKLRISKSETRLHLAWTFY